MYLVEGVEVEADGAREEHRVLMFSGGWVGGWVGYLIGWLVGLIGS